MSPHDMLEDQDPPRLTAEELKKYFPAETRPVLPGAFELGLVLAGTVSAGAYTGGVLDFLFEALDAWQRAKDAGDPNAPQHNVVITTVAGASGGAISGAILLRGAGREFEHGQSLDNPFYSAWTRGVDLMKLLSLQGDDAGFSSLFNTRAIEETANTTITWDKGRPLGTSTSPAQRKYLADPLRLFMMVGNVTGIPYEIPMRGESGLGHDLVSHADYMRFALTVPGGPDAQLASRPDEFALASGSTTNWGFVRDAALATSAFPLAFRARLLQRGLPMTAYRALAIPTPSGPPDIRQLVPLWRLLPRGESDSKVAPFANVDGGTFNNEPLDVARTAMAGLASFNERTPDSATRAVVMVDPFSDADMLSVPDTGDLTAMILPLLSSMLAQSRFKPEDVALAYDEDVYSRFLVAPVRRDAAGQPIVGARAIASGGLGGFLGFVDSRLLDHDYMLGRVNAQAFLARHLMLPEDANNPLFASWTAAQKNKYRYIDPRTGTKYLPIVPLMDGVTVPPPPQWPTGVTLPANFDKAVEARLDSIFAKLKQELLPKSGLVRALSSGGLGLAWSLFIRSALRDAIHKVFQEGLQKQGL